MNVVVLLVLAVGLSSGSPLTRLNIAVSYKHDVVGPITTLDRLIAKIDFNKDNLEWELWKVAFNKTYASSKEEEDDQQIKKHNQEADAGDPFIITMTREEGWKTKKGKSVKGSFTYTSPAGQTRSFATLELPWLDNKSNVSCIPAGTYRPIKRFSEAPPLGKRLSVPNVPGRRAIRIHKGNSPKNTKGCILVGQPSGTPDWIEKSGHTMDILWDDIGTNSATLIIK